MKNTMEYKGYVGSIEFSEADGVFFGKVQGIRSLLSYEGTNASELIADFHGAVDEYLDLCEKEGQVPETAYKGSLNVRLGSELHKRAAVYAISQQQSLNSFLEEAVRDKLTAVNALGHTVLLEGWNKLLQRHKLIPVLLIEDFYDIIKKIIP